MALVVASKPTTVPTKDYQVVKVETALIIIKVVSSLISTRQTL
jgi:hypothetical protein